MKNCCILNSQRKVITRLLLILLIITPFLFTSAQQNNSSEKDQNFIELLRTDAGVNQKQVTKTQYSELETSLARRTYDESGDYTVKNFEIDIRLLEYYSTEFA